MAIAAILELGMLNNYCKSDNWFLKRSVACRGGCERCNGPGHPPWRASKRPVFVRKM